MSQTTPNEQDAVADGDIPSPLRSASPEAHTPVGSPEKISAKRSRPNPVTPTKPIDIEIPTNSAAPSGSDQSSQQFNINKLPVWIAGSSPAKFISLEDLVKMSSSLEKMAIIHEIAIDPKFDVESLKKGDAVHEAVKESMHRAYWELLKKEFTRLVM